MLGLCAGDGNDNIGRHGVELDESVYDKVAEIHEHYP